MSDRHFAFTVCLDREYKDEDAELIASAIRMVKGVMSVEAHVADVPLYYAKESARQELAAKLLAVLHPNKS